ncbi:NADH oxidoreductase [Sodalis sp. dw_96]|uniref:NADH oxidoreductase n=1 Tax=Sodalis sp. dw_96 TaxID=2719794 RepID=UPI001BD4800A|nr:NADH oxidoreductase [Sodalis sp. dw_96]
MLIPHGLCTHAMQVHHIEQETPDVWTLSLINHDVYAYEPGQFALVSINNSETLRAYTLSSTPGQSRFVTLTVRRLENGSGSGWLTRRVKTGDTLWLSDAQGDFTCARQEDERYLFLAAGCGVTPIMSMCRWLAANRPRADVQVIYSVRTPREVIFAKTWPTLQPWLRLTLFAEQQAVSPMIAGRLDRAHLAALVPDIATRRVMACGPAPYMDLVEKDAMALGATGFMQERFHTTAVTGTQRLKITVTRLQREFSAPVGMSLLEALEANNIPVNAACRAGVCGCCKTRILAGRYTAASTATLSPAEIAEGYVLACSCRLEGDVVVA